MPATFATSPASSRSIPGPGGSAGVERRVLDEAPAQRSLAGDFHHVVDLDLDRPIGALEVGVVGRLPQDARPPGELQGRAPLEVDEQQADALIDRDVAE